MPTTRITSGLLILLAISTSSLLSGLNADEQATLPVEVEIAFPNIRVNRPIVITHAGDNSNRLFVASQLGKIHVMDNDQEVAETTIFFDLEAKVQYADKMNEEGLLGFAFHPEYRKTGHFFIYYTIKDAARTSVISRFTVSKDDPNKADPASEVELMRIKQPFWNHNGGTIAFGHDGYLYVGLGDGGKANDPFKNGQNLGTLHGSILRIDVDRHDAGKAYAIPRDNPFVGVEGARAEIYAYGFRNVWRLSFDRKTGSLFAADVGQDIWEEINVVVKGGNYGWNLREARHKFGAAGADEAGDMIDPILEYNHTVGKSITGGHVYRGDRVKALAGKYIYADYVSGIMWALDLTKDNQAGTNYTIPWSKLPVLTFGEDEDGDVYFGTHLSGGRLYRFQDK
jgi:glucose/arabinose dehydrogenase